MSMKHFKLNNTLVLFHIVYNIIKSFGIEIIKGALNGYTHKTSKYAKKSTRPIQDNRYRS